MLHGSDSRATLDANQAPLSAVASADSNASTNSTNLATASKTSFHTAQNPLSPPASSTVSATLTRDEGLSMTEPDDACSSPVITSPASSRTSQADATLAAPQSRDKTCHTPSNSVLLSPSQLSLPCLKSPSSLDPASEPFSVSPRALARATMSGLNSPPPTSLDDLTASLSMAPAELSINSSNLPHQGLSPSHSDSSPEEDALQRSTPASPDPQPTPSQLLADALQNQARLATTMAAVDRRTRLQRLRLQTYIATAHAAALSSQGTSSQTPGLPTLTGVALDEPTKQIDNDDTPTTPTSTAAAAATTGKRRSPTVSPEVILHDAKRVHRHLAVLAQRRPRVKRVKRRFDEAHAPFDPEATDDSDLEDNMLENELAHPQRKQFYGTIYSADMNLHQAEAKLRRRRHQWLHEREQLHWRLRWLEEQARQLDAVVSSTPSTDTDTAVEARHPALLTLDNQDNETSDQDVCSRAMAVDAAYRRPLLDPTVVATSNRPVQAKASPLTNHRSYRTLAATLDPGFHPCLSRPAHAPLAVLHRVQAQAAAYYKARTETLTLKSAQLKAVGQTTSHPKRRKGQLPGRSSSGSSVTDSNHRRPQRKSSQPDSLSSHGKSTRRSSARSSADKRKLDWDAVSLPAGFAPSHVDTSMLDRKEIATPSFSTTKIGAKLQPTTSLISLPEDLAPAAFAKRHDPQELRELAAWNTQKKGSTKALAVQPARPCKPRHFKGSEQYPKRTFPLNAEQQAKLKVVHDDSSVFSVAALPAAAGDSPTEAAHPAFKLVFKLKKQDA
eukprot:m.144391 g.144391  ORF g.144391 m.144391 type:complete len:784 (+) comp16195_c0_seq1:743-3094(+)